jgi:ParB-like chromosome segregation protein Spo0J
MSKAIMVVSLTKIRRCSQQPRVQRSEEAVQDYSKSYRDKVELPPPVLFNDGGEIHWIGDGDHRVEARKRAGFKEIKPTVRSCFGRFREWSGVVV